MCRTNILLKARATPSSEYSWITLELFNTCMSNMQHQCLKGARKICGKLDLWFPAIDVMDALCIVYNQILVAIL